MEYPTGNVCPKCRYSTGYRLLFEDHCQLCYKQSAERYMRIVDQERAIKSIQHTCPKCQVDRYGYEYSVGDRCCEVCFGLKGTMR